MPGGHRAAQEFGGLTDDQIANAYGAFGLYSPVDPGAGQPSLSTSSSRSCALIPDVRHLLLRRRAGGADDVAAACHPGRGRPPAGPGSGEALLDVEDVSAMAPGAESTSTRCRAMARTDRVRPGRRTCHGRFRPRARDQYELGAVRAGRATGQPGLQQAENLLFEQAAAQGQSVFSASGDTGDDDLQRVRPPSPASGQNPLSLIDPVEPALCRRHRWYDDHRCRHLAAG